MGEMGDMSATDDHTTPYDDTMRLEMDGWTLTSRWMDEWMDGRIDIKQP
jgi:hypothetical protein